MFRSLFAVELCIMIFGITGVCCNLDVKNIFQQYIVIFNKPYGNDSKEYLYRLRNFNASIHRIRQLNQNSDNIVKYGLTEYSDMSKREFEDSVIGTRKRVKHSAGDTGNGNGNGSRLDLDRLKNVPKKFDWRDQGAVTEVKNQKSCGACWAFSTVETMESMMKLKTGKLQEFSVQQVIDCAKGGNNGCNGGDTCTVLDWMNQTNFQITTEDKYPLTDVYGSCKMINSSIKVQLQSNFTCKQYKGQEETTMVELIATHGPLVVAVDATTWQDYLGGIIQYHCDTRTNHAVQIVGYDLTGEVPYFIVRNSWGPEFGLNGYLHIAIGKNLCGLADRVSTLDVV